jgi:RNA polymerase sigma-70 factor (ECF subfamily)
MWVILAVLGRPASASDEERLADRAALARMARGDESGLAELYDRHSRLVFSLALRILQNRADAEDVVQEVFAQVWTQARRYEGERGSVAAWMLMMARSRAIDRLRSRRARPESGGQTPAAQDVADAAPTQDLQLLSNEEVAKLREALDGLPAVQRTALELAYYEGLTHAEIAQRLSEPLGTVKTRIRQAVIKLRESLASRE